MIFGSKSNLSIVLAAFQLWCFTACAFDHGDLNDGDGSGTTTTPTVLSNAPVHGAVDVPLNGSVSATFSEAMEPSSLTGTTFTLTSGATAIPVLGAVIYADSTVTFSPATYLASNREFTATITTEATSTHGVALATEHSWTFTGNSVAPGIPVNLGTAANYVVLAKSGIIGTTATVTGDLGVSPAAATYITGLSLIADSTNTFSTSAQVTGKVYAASYVAPTPAILTTAVSDMELAFTAAAARAPDVTELDAGVLGSLTLLPRVYSWSTGLTIPTNLTLEGSESDVWIFQIVGDLTLSGGVIISLTGGAQAKNVFWQVSGAVTLAAMAHLEGVVLTATAVTLAADASIHGRLLTQTSADISGSTVVAPAL